MNSQQDSTSTVPSAMNADPLVRLGLRLAAAMRLEDDFDARARAANDVTARLYLQGAEGHAADEVATIRDMIAGEKATTLEGALVQICELMSRVEVIWGAVPPEVTDNLMVRDHRAVERIMYSIFDVLEAAASCTLAELVHPDFGNPHRNPWTPVDERLAAIEARS